MEYVNGYFAPPPSDEILNAALFSPQFSPLYMYIMC